MTTEFRIKDVNNWAQPIIEGDYLYTRASWKPEECRSVYVSVATTGVWITFHEGYFPIKLPELPADAVLTRIDYEQ